MTNPITPVHTPAFVGAHPRHDHPIELALALAVITIEALTLLLVHAITLALVLAGYRPRPQIPAAELFPEKSPEIPSPVCPEKSAGKTAITTPAPAEPCGAGGADPADQDQSQHPADPAAMAAPVKKAPRARKTTAPRPAADRASARPARRRKSPVPIADS